MASSSSHSIQFVHDWDEVSTTSEIIVTCGQSVDIVETSALNRRAALTSPSGVRRRSVVITEIAALENSYVDETMRHL